MRDRRMHGCEQPKAAAEATECPARSRRLTDERAKVLDMMSAGIVRSASIAARLHARLAGLPEPETPPEPERTDRGVALTEELADGLTMEELILLLGPVDPKRERREGSR